VQGMACGMHTCWGTDSTVACMCGVWGCIGVPGVARCGSQAAYIQYTSCVVCMHALPRRLVTRTRTPVMKACTLHGVLGLIMPSCCLPGECFCTVALAATASSSAVFSATLLPSAPVHVRWYMCRGCCGCHTCPLCIRSCACVSCLAFTLLQHAFAAVMISARVAGSGCCWPHCMGLGAATWWSWIAVCTESSTSTTALLHGMHPANVRDLLSFMAPSVAC
jgi:hypothetical protein